MPAKSERQRRWAFAMKGEKWARKHHMDKVQKSPVNHALRKKGKR